MEDSGGPGEAEAESGLKALMTMHLFKITFARDSEEATFESLEQVQSIAS